MRSLLKGATILTVVGLVPLFPLSAGAADVTSENISKRLDQLQRIVDEQQKVIAEQQGRLSAVEQMLLSPETQIEGLSGGLGGVHEASYVRGKRRSIARQAQTEGEGTEPVAPVAPTDEQTGAEPAPVAPTDTPADTPAEAAPAETPPADGETPAPAEEGTALVDEKPEEIKEAREELLLDTGGVLLPPGTIQVEPFFDYTHTSSDRVNILGFTIFEAIVIGLIRVDQIERDIYRPGVNVRAGIFDRFQLEATVPGTYRRDTEILGVGTPGQAEVVTDGFNIGDIEIAGAYQMTSQQPWIPASVFRLRARFPTGLSAFEIDTVRIEVNDAQRTVLEETPTGSGFYSIAPGATFIWRADPVAFFGGTSYTINLPRDQGAFGDIDPGDTVEFFAGLNVALSDRVGLNLSFVNQLTGRTVVNDVEQDGTDANDARVTIGASYGLTPDISILTSASVGLTQESPDFVFLVSTPLTFQLF